MSPANIEEKLTSADALVGQAICIGDGRRYNVALTPTMKLKRKPIAAKYAVTIEDLYASRS
jgi:long-subunit acyl-CoA synthetase (AMP-forming)